MSDTRTTIRNIIQKDQPEQLIIFAEKEGRELATLEKKQERLTTTQIRNVFGQVRQIEAMWRIPAQREQAERLLLLLKPRIAYQAAKEKKQGVEQLARTLTDAIDAICENTAPYSNERKVRFSHFVDLFEAILAYHKTAGGE